MSCTLLDSHAPSHCKKSVKRINEKFFTFFKLFSSQKYSSLWVKLWLYVSLFRPPIFFYSTKVFRNYVSCTLAFQRTALFALHSALFDNSFISEYSFIWEYLRWLIIQKILTKKKFCFEFWFKSVFIIFFNSSKYNNKKNFCFAFSGNWNFYCLKALSRLKEKIFV